MDLRPLRALAVLVAASRSGCEIRYRADGGKFRLYNGKEFTELQWPGGDKPPLQFSEKVRVPGVLWCGRPGSTRAGKNPPLRPFWRGVHSPSSVCGERLRVRHPMCTDWKSDLRSVQPLRSFTESRVGITMKNHHIVKDFHDMNSATMRRFGDLQLQLGGCCVPYGLHVGAREASFWIGLTHGRKWSFWKRVDP